MAVAAERIPAGTTITAAMVEAVEVPASVSFVDGLVRFDDLGESSVAARTVQPGEAIAALGARGPVTASSGARVMAIPVESWQAAGGELDVGDQVDVIDTGESGPRLRVERCGGGRPGDGGRRRRAGGVARRASCGSPWR